MGDFSRDTFKLTNALHQLITGETVANPRHYVGVRLQQGVPLLDADWNELEDTRSAEVRALMRYFIGDGVPAGNNGFLASESGVNNDFAINQGVILVDGMFAINLSVTTYSGQSAAAGLPALTTPSGGTDRTDIVYLDIWNEEVGGSGMPSSDSRLVDERVGIETSVRVVRSWQVRVAQGATDLAGVAVSPGHRLVPLALLHRRHGEAAIREAMIVDLRKQGVTLADNLKIPMYIRRGLEIVNVQRFSQLLKGLRDILFSRLKDNQLPYQTAAPSAQKKETLILMSLQTLLHLAQTGEVQTLHRVTDNADALRLLGDLYDAQDEWIDILEELGNNASVAQTFIDQYRDYLIGNATLFIKGLKPALDQKDLIAAVIAQETLNFWLTSAVGTLPEGSVDAVYLSVIPYENLTAGSSYDFTYEVMVNFTSPQVSEDFQVQITLPSAFGSVTVDQPLLTFSPPEGSATITVTVTPLGTINSADMDISVFAVRNATLRSPQPPISLTLNALPPVAAFFFYAGPRFNPEGRLEIPQNHLTRTQGRNIIFSLKNDSASENRTYQVTGRIVPNAADTTGWSPLSPTALPLITLAPGGQTDVLVRVDGPKSPAPAPPVGTTGNIITEAVLSAIDGTPPGAPQPVAITVPFIVI